MSEEELTMSTPSMMEQMQAMFAQMRDSIDNNNNSIINNINNINNTMNTMNNKFDNKFDTMETLNEARRIELLGLIDQRSQRSTRAPSRATSRAVSPKSLVAQVSARLESGVQEPPINETPRVNSFGPDLSLTQVFRDKDATRQLAASLIATIPVTIAHIIVPLLKAPPLCSMVTDIKSSPTPIEPIQFLTIKEIVQPFEIVIGVPVRTNVSQYNITPPARSNHPFEDIPEGDNLSTDFDVPYQEETLNHYYSDGQPSNMVPQLQNPWPIFNEDNSWGDKLECFPGDRNATSYSVCGSVFGSITVALVT
jgi:hypothetical protein